ncbi:MAG: glutamate--tRNA ligase [Spirochaetaceae bacterium]|jgi:glutamyl-tRNA synthetase|nr:glutamate--tRNA ligase [Spirochaetaceae bacterium]
MEVRVRYAPSPTGLQHIGGLRTALFNYLFARSQKGVFILRLEDTDRTRCDDAYVRNLYDTFAWLGFRWDEGPDSGGPFSPYIQSERTGLYRRYAHELVAAGKAYYCFCPPERLDAVRKEREAAHSSQTGYDRFCRTLDAQEAAQRAQTEQCVIRLKIPLDAATRFTDRLIGEVVWKNNDINPDPVLLKSDGFPTYHLANIVDDHLMGITHVLRAQEWLASTPLHVILYEALGWEPPEFCHLPMVMGQDGKKLSKRHGATSVDEFRKNGVLPHALLNYVALLGMSYEEGREIYSLDELVARFNPEKLNKAQAVFDYKKLEWFNTQYIKEMDDEELAAQAIPFAREINLFGPNGAVPCENDRTLFIKALPLVKERAAYLGELAEKLRYLFAEPPLPEASVFMPKKATHEDTLRLLRIGRGFVEELARLNEADGEALVKRIAEDEDVKLGDLLMPLRVALTGTRVSPPLFGSVILLGARRAAQRVDKALSMLAIPPVNC